MIEAGVVVDVYGNPIYWHLPPGRSGGSLPDSRSLWEVMWESHKKNELMGFAHSHPGSGLPGPSYTDVTTFAAIEAALGRRLMWWITSADRFVVVIFRKEKNGYQATEIPHPLPCDVSNCWVEELRRLSEGDLK